LNTLERRLKLLKLEGLGFSRQEIRTELTSEYDCSPRTVRRDFQHRKEWQPLIEKLDPETSLLKTVNRLDTIYRKAAFIMLQSSNELARIAAMKVMLESTKARLTLTNPKVNTIEAQLISKPEITVEMWRPEHATHRTE